MPALAEYKCLHCKRELAANQRGVHCQRCGWVKCSCGAINDVKMKHATHHDHLMACQDSRSPCQLRSPKKE